MKERGLIFSGPMVRANLDGRKSQTRRVVNPQPVVFDNAGFLDIAALKDPKRHWLPGDRFYMRETYCHGDEWDDTRASEVDPLCGGNDIWYFADGPRPTEGWGKKRPCIHMPKWATRIWFEITDIRVERVQDISEEDAKAEGVEWLPIHPGNSTNYVRSFADLWDSINTKRGYGWIKNPWVFVINYKKIVD